MADQKPRDDVDRIPPHNLEAEMALIGSILVDKEMMSAVGDRVTPSDFYAHVHETLFTVLVDLFDRAEPLDKISVAEELRRRDALERVGGVSYLTALMGTVQTAASARYYADIVREKSILRSLIRAGTIISENGFEGDADVAAALDRSEQLVYSLRDRRAFTDLSGVSQLLKGAYDEIVRLHADGGSRSGVTSGFADIDRVTAGFQPANLVIVAARPGMGKTSFALNMAVAVASANSMPIAFFSLEMSSAELVQRLISSDAKLSMTEMRRGNIRDNQWDAIAASMGRISDLPIYLDDRGALTVSEIRSRCRRLRSSSGLRAVFVDYLQLLRPGALTRQATRNDELAEISRDLKVTAKELGVPIIALAQLNRGVETRSDKRPVLADLRDSGAIEAEADVVAFLYRDGYYNPETPDPELTEFIIAKHRNGPTETVRLRFKREFTLFQPYGDDAYYPSP